MLIFCCSFSPLLWAGQLDLFIQRVKVECPRAQALLVKKSLIEMIKGDETCQERYLQLLLAECQSLSCSDLVYIYKIAKEQSSGTVMGR